MTRVFLLLLLELPPSRQSPYHIQLLDVSIDSVSKDNRYYGLPIEMCHTVDELIVAFKTKETETCGLIIEELLSFRVVTEEQHLILHKLEKKIQK